MTYRWVKAFIKLDASFVAENEHSEQAVAVLRSVTALGTGLDMPVLAEGIEQPAQLSIVAREDAPPSKVI